MATQQPLAHATVPRRALVVAVGLAVILAALAAIAAGVDSLRAAAGSLATFLAGFGATLQHQLLLALAAASIAECGGTRHQGAAWGRRPAGRPPALNLRDAARTV